MRTDSSSVLRERFPFFGERAQRVQFSFGISREALIVYHTRRANRIVLSHGLCIVDCFDKLRRY